MFKMQDLNMKMFDALLKAVTKVIHKWRDICLRAGILNVLELSSVPRLISQYNTIPMKASPGFFMDPTS